MATGRSRRTTWRVASGDRKSTRLNSSHLVISYAVFCLKKKKNRTEQLDNRVGLPQLSAVAYSRRLYVSTTHVRQLVSGRVSYERLKTILSYSPVVQPYV